MALRIFFPSREVDVALCFLRELSHRIGMKNFIYLTSCLFSFLVSTCVYAGTWFVSWGYNKDYWAPTDIHVSQPALSNDFTIHHVTAKDYPQWDDGLAGQFWAPQYNIRLGRYLNSSETLALEFNFDHTKYKTVNEQSARITGMIAGEQVDRTQVLDTQFFEYFLHNGANHMMLALLYDAHVFRSAQRAFRTDVLLRWGAGVMLPHTSSTVMGNSVDVGKKAYGNYLGINTGWWRLNGWTTGIEVGLREFIFSPIFLEFTDKLAFSRMINVPAYEGTIDHNLWMNELILTLGTFF